MNDGDGFGSSVGDFSHFVPGTFNFYEIIEEFTSKTFKGGNISEHYSIAFQRKGSTSTVAVHTKNEDLVKKIFELAHENRGRGHIGRNVFVKKSDPNVHMNILWHKQPPFPIGLNDNAKNRLKALGETVFLVNVNADVNFVVCCEINIVEKTLLL